MSSTDQDYSTGLQGTVEKLTQALSEQVAARVEEVAFKYSQVIVEKDREIEGLRGALKQSAKDFLQTNKECNLNAMVEEAHGTAKEKGWWDQVEFRSPLELHMLMVSEIAEATEAARKEHGSKVEAGELADCVIRIMDYFGHMGWDLSKEIRTKMDYNKTRPYRHGNKLY